MRAPCRGLYLTSTKTTLAHKMPLMENQYRSRCPAFSENVVNGLQAALSENRQSMCMNFPLMKTTSVIPLFLDETLMRLPSALVMETGS